MRKRASTSCRSASITAATPASPTPATTILADAAVPDASDATPPGVAAVDRIPGLEPTRCPVPRQQPRAIVSDLGAVPVSQAEIDLILGSLDREIADLFHGAA